MMKTIHGVTLQDKYQLFIGGEWRDASDGATFKTKCPANGELLAECAQATQHGRHLKPGKMSRSTKERLF